MRTLHAFALITLVVAGCRPASMDNYLYNTSTDQVQIKATDTDNRVTLAGPAGQSITALKKLSTADERKGSFKPDGAKYVSLHSNTDHLHYDVEIEMGKKTCKTTTAGGVPLTNNATFNVSCVAEDELNDQIKAACKELSADKTIAEFSETATSCKCLNREDKDLKYTDYSGRVTAFKQDCKNSATTEQLKEICTEIKTKFCPTCIVESLSCECPSKKSLFYSQYLKNVEGFRKDCGGEPKKDDDIQMGPLTPEASLEKDCKELKGEFRKKDGEAPTCVCKDIVGFFEVESVITVEEYRTGGRKLLEEKCPVKP